MARTPHADDGIAVSTATANWEELVNDGIEARKLGDQSNWRLGDLASSVEKHYGAADIEKYASRIGVPYNTLRQYRTVSMAFKNDERSSNLSWAHHLVVSGRDDAAELLGLAEHGSWSVEQLRDEVRSRNEKPSPPLPEGQYAVLYADPPWAYDNSGFTFSAAQHYQTMAPEEIAAYVDAAGRSVRDLAHENAVLFMWTTNPQLWDARQVLEGWGFEYKTNIAWDKGRAVPGFYVDGSHELLIIATRGSCLPKQRPPVSVFALPATKHSRKPDEFYDLIESMYEGPYLELFARRPREGWAVWGNEV